MAAATNTTIFDVSKSPSITQLDTSQNDTIPRSTRHGNTTTTTTPPPPPIESESPRSIRRSTSGHIGQENYRLMKKVEWLQFCRGIGILKDEESDEVIRVTGRLWPPNGFKDGLYRDVLYEKTKFGYYYHALSIACWFLMLLQLALSAVLTALGATSIRNGTPITVLAAVNTSVAGILALLHNSGLPDRYRWDRNEFYRLEEHLKAIIDTGLVPAHYSVNDVLAECFDMLAVALQTVQNNAPTMYAPAAATTTTFKPPPPPLQMTTGTGQGVRGAEMGAGAMQRTPTLGMERMERMSRRLDSEKL